MQEEDTEVEGVEFTSLQVFMHGVRVDAIAWSPETRLDKLPLVIRYGFEHVLLFYAGVKPNETDGL